MNEKFFEALSPYVKKVMDGIERGIDFAQQEIPIVLEQLIMFEAVKHIFYGLVIPIILLILANKYWKYVERIKDDYDKSDNDSLIVTRFLFKFGTYVASFVLFTKHIVPAIKAMFFPKLFLVQYFFEMMS